MNTHLVVPSCLHHTSFCLPCLFIWSFLLIIMNCFSLYHWKSEKGREWGREKKRSDCPQVVFRSIFAKTCLLWLWWATLWISQWSTAVAWLDLCGKCDSRKKCNSRYQCFCFNLLKMLHHAPNVVSLLGFAATSMMTVIHLKTIPLKYS